MNWKITNTELSCLTAFVIQKYWERIYENNW